MAQEQGSTIIPYGELMNEQEVAQEQDATISLEN